MLFLSSQRFPAATGPMGLRLVCALAMTAAGASAAPGAPPAESLRQTVKEIGESVTRGGSSRAIVELGKAVKAGDRDLRVEAGYHLGRAYAFEGQDAEAMAAWAKALAEAPRRGYLWSLLKVAMAELHHRKGEDEQALQCYDDVLEDRSGGHVSFTAAVGSGDVRMKRKEYDRAVKAYEWAESYARTAYPPLKETGDLGKKLAEARRLREIGKSGLDEVLFREAEQLRAGQRWREAREKYEELTVRFRDGAHVPPSTWAIGECLAGEGRLDDAITYWKQFIRLDEKGPWRGQAFVSLGDLLLEEKLDLAAAKTAYTRAYDLYTGDARTVAGWPAAAYSIHQRQGVLAYVAGDKKATLEWFERAARNSPPSSYEVVAGYVPSAIERLMVRLRRGGEPTPPEARRGDPRVVVMQVVADLHAEAEDYAKSRRLHERVLQSKELRPGREQRAWSTYQLGRMHYWTFEFEPAIRRFLEVADAYAGVPWADEALVRAGVVHFTNLRKPEEAIRFYDRVLREYPASNQAPRAAFFLGVAYRTLRQYDKALAVYDRLMKTWPKSEFAETARAWELPEIRGKMEAEKP